MACSGCFEQELRGPTCRADIRRIKPATDVFNAGSPTRRCRRFWPACDTTSKHEAALKTWKAISTGRTFRRKKGGPRWPLSRGERHQGHGNRRPQWSSTRSLSCERKSIRQCAHRANSRRCFRGQATAPLDRRQSVGRWGASTATLERTKNRSHRTQTWWPASESTSSRRAQASPLQATLACRNTLRASQTISSDRHALGCEVGQLPRIPSTRSFCAVPARPERTWMVMRSTLDRRNSLWRKLPHCPTCTCTCTCTFHVDVHDPDPLRHPDTSRLLKASA